MFDLKIQTRWKEISREDGESYWINTLSINVERNTAAEIQGFRILKWMRVTSFKEQLWTRATEVGGVCGCIQRQASWNKDRGKLESSVMFLNLETSKEWYSLRRLKVTWFHSCFGRKTVQKNPRTPRVCHSHQRHWAVEKWAVWRDNSQASVTKDPNLPTNSSSQRGQLTSPMARATVLRNLKGTVRKQGRLFPQPGWSETAGRRKKPPVAPDLWPGWGSQEQRGWEMTARERCTKRIPGLGRLCSHRK